jgi:hypothetical protein
MAQRFQLLPFNGNMRGLPRRPVYRNVGRPPLQNLPYHPDRRGEVPAPFAPLLAGLPAQSMPQIERPSRALRC